MSLTRHLDDPRSPVRELVTWATPLLTDAGGNTAEARLVKNMLGIGTLPSLVLPNLEGANPSTVGTAFDYWVRYHLAVPARTDLVAFSGASIVAKLLVPEAAPAITSFFTNLDRLGGSLDLSKPMPDATQVLLARYCVVLALFESVRRTGLLRWDLPASDTITPSTPETEPMLQAARETEVAALMSLGTSTAPMISLWRDRADAGTAYVANPTFAGSSSVGGADADLVLHNEIIEIKTVKELTAASVRKALLQLVGYTLFDWDDSCAIRQVGVFFARHDYRDTWPISSLIRPPGTNKLAWVIDGGEPDGEALTERLGELRDMMQQVVSGHAVELPD